MKVTKKNLIGARATSITEAGVQMAANISTGEHDQHREVVGVFKTGKIIDAKRIVIDYSKWPDVEDVGGVISYKWIGRVHSYECFVENQIGERGWVAAGALHPCPSSGQPD